MPFTTSAPPNPFTFNQPQNSSSPAQSQYPSYQDPSQTKQPPPPPPGTPTKINPNQQGPFSYTGPGTATQVANPYGQVSNGNAYNQNVYNQMTQGPTWNTQSINPAQALPNYPTYAPPSIPGNQMNQSIEQQAIGGSARANQIQNFLTALKGVGAGNNNTFMNSGNAVAPTVQPLLQGNYNNANAGTIGYVNPGSWQDTLNQTGNISGYNDLNATGGKSMYLGAPSPQEQAMANFNASTNPNVGNNLTNSVKNLGMSAAGPPMPSAVQPMFNQVQPQFTNNNLSPDIYSALFSDESLKENIKPGDKDLTDFLNTIGHSKYEYKDEKHGVGTFVSPMAQELRKTKLGKSAVIDTPEGLKVDYSRLEGITLSALSLLNKKLNRLKSEIKVRK